MLRPGQIEDIGRLPRTRKESWTITYSRRTITKIDATRDGLEKEQLQLMTGFAAIATLYRYFDIHNLSLQRTCSFRGASPQTSTARMGPALQ